ncbi:hypothetical protein QQX98_007357 [Neonectria punicea]|uniref:Uncharacterized protein n=1 Tax=Neonectria punicea TaxID=979145 RepID=A0ABR1GY86_9HYPO
MPSTQGLPKGAKHRDFRAVSSRETSSFPIDRVVVQIANFTSFIVQHYFIARREKIIHTRRTQYSQGIASMYLDESSDALLASSAGGFEITRLRPREAKDSCHPQANINLCEKSQVSSKTVLVGVIGAMFICVCCFFAFLWHLHRKRTKRDIQEDIKGQELDDYGIELSSAPSKTSRMPQAPPPAQMRRETADTRTADPPPSYRMSQESLSPSLRQAMGVAPRDTLANK